MSPFAYGSCICDLVIMGVNVSPLPKMALLLGIFKVLLFFPFRYKCHIPKKAFPDHTSGRLDLIYTPIEQ